MGDEPVQRHSHRGFGCSSRLAGSGAGLGTAVLVGGAFQRKEAWGRLEEQLLKSFDVLTVDLPGWGDADTLPSSYGIDFLAGALLRILDDRGVDQAVMVGGSYGSAIAYQFAQQHPERVSRLTLAGTMLAFPAALQEPVRATLRLLRQGRVEEFAEATVGLFMTRDDGVLVTNGRVIERILRTRFTAITEDEAEKYQHNTDRLLRLPPLVPDPAPPVPTLVFTGEHDRFTTPAACRAVAETCPDAWLATIAEADHMAHLERPAECAEMIRRFAAGASLLNLPFCRTSQAVISATRAVQRTSDLVAEIRAREARRPDAFLHDTAARLFSSPWSAATADLAEAIQAPIEPVIVRSRFGESIRRQAADQGIRQIVALGAGGDSRMWRATVSEGTTYYELDLPGQLEGKAKILADAGFATTFAYHPVEADLLQSWHQPLLAAGFEPHRPSYWIAEGISWYLASEQLDQMLTTVTSLSASGSHISIDLPHPDFHSQPDLQPFLDAMRRLGSPFASPSTLTPTRLQDLGWQTTALWYPDLGPGPAHPYLPAVPQRLSRAIPLWLVHGSR